MENALLHLCSVCTGTRLMCVQLVVMCVQLVVMCVQLVVMCVQLVVVCVQLVVMCVQLLVVCVQLVVVCVHLCSSDVCTASNKIFYVSSNYSLTVLYFVCFTMYFYRLLCTLTVHKIRSGWEDQISRPYVPRWGQL